MLDIRSDIHRWHLDGETRVAAVLLVELKGSGVRQPGAMFAVAGNGQIAGSVSGGCIEPQLIDAAERLLTETRGAVSLVRYDHSGGRLFSPLQPCSDSVELALFQLDLGVYNELCEIVDARREAQFSLVLEGADAGTQSVAAIAGGRDRPPEHLPRFESERGHIEVVHGRRVFDYQVSPPADLVLVGASHIGQEIAAAADRVGFRLHVVDTRERFLTEHRFPAVASRLVSTPQKAFDTLAVGERTAVCAISHDDKLDDAAIVEALKRNCYYIGALGSRRTHAERCERLVDMGVAPERLDEIRAPIGISIGAVTPAEIAISIVAEVTGAYRMLVPKRS